jgi:high-affinity nickel-transport protein
MVWMLIIYQVRRGDFVRFQHTLLTCIQAIDNATRRIVSVPLAGPEGVSRIRRPVTVGLFFSLGHSTVVIATIIAIAVSAGVASGLDGFGNVGSIIGPAVSGSFLILIGCINSYILYQTWKRYKGETSLDASKSHFNGIMTRLAMPLLRTVDRPWKLYPVGVLFGLGFDTASSIALLSVAIIAQNSGQGNGSGNTSVVLLAFLFTAGMTMVDSIDSCLMIWAYAPDLTSKGKMRTGIWEAGKTQEEIDVIEEAIEYLPEQIDDQKEEIEIRKDEAQMKDVNLERDGSRIEVKALAAEKENIEKIKSTPSNHQEATVATDLRSKIDRSASQLSIILTTLSIIIAFAVGIVELLGLIGQQCARCTRAADLQESSGKGGLEGRWWLTWRRANDNFGYIGAAIVGLFAVAVSAYFIARWMLSKRQRRQLDHHLRVKEG